MQSPANTVKRSLTYQAMYPDELMMDAFGTTMPTPAQRNIYFFDKWMSWRDHSIILPGHVDSDQVVTICKTLGLRKFWDYQLRGHNLRFCDADMLAFFKIAASDVKWS